jgi:hypothetical protein
LHIKISYIRDNLLALGVLNLAFELGLASFEGSDILVLLGLGLLSIGDEFGVLLLSGLFVCGK